MSLIRKYIKKQLIRFTEPSELLFESHIEKAKHNLFVASLLQENSLTDWQIITSYYAIYHSIIGLLNRIGIISKNHNASILLLENIFIKENILKKHEIKKVKEIKNLKKEIMEQDVKKIKNIKEIRVDAQYTIKTNFKNEIADNALNFARNFVSKIERIEIKDNIFKIVENLKC